MAKHKNDDYEEFGDIDSVFELDQSALEEEVEDTEIDQETRNKYMYDEGNSSDNVDDYEDEDDYYDPDDDLVIKDDELESDDEVQEIKDELPSEEVLNNLPQIEESEEDQVEVDEDSESETDDITEEIQEETVVEDEDSEELEETTEETESEDVEVDEDSETETDDIEESIVEDVDYDESEGTEPQDDKEAEVDEAVNADSNEDEDDDLPDIETPQDMEKRVKETADDETYEDFMRMSFRTRVDAYYQRYSEEDILTYIEKYAEPDDRAIIKDLYITEYVKYSQFVDFKNDKEARADLWVLACGVFADTIEHDKIIGKIETEVIQTKEIADPHIIGDPNIEETKLYQKEQSEKYDKYKIDEEDIENSSIFDDKRTLDRDFYESEFYKIHKEVMTPDRYCDMSQIHSQVHINIDTSYLPVIDYSTGVRVICVDTNDTDQYRINPFLIHRKVRFSYRIPWRDVKLRILYSDNAKNNPQATIASLKKIVAYKYINERYKITLNRNYTIAYTTDPKFIDMFENGDPDSKRAESSYAYVPKPYNCQLGVIVLAKKTDKDRKSIRRNQIRRDIGKYEKPSVDDYDIHFVLSARIVKNDLRLRNPTLPPEERYVEYTITQYTEINSVIIEDGFQVITACLIKEHMEHYGRGVGYSVAYEYDRDGLVTPAIVGMLDARDGVAPQVGSKPNMADVASEFTLPPSRLKLDGVFPFEKGRIDPRNFAPITIQRRYPRDLWSNYDLSTQDGRYEFIRSRGFEEFIHMKPVVFDVEPSALNMLFSSDMIRNITKVSMDALRDKNSSDTEAILYKQSELEYINSLGEGKYGTFHKLLFSAFDSILDSLSKSK